MRPERHPTWLQNAISRETLRFLAGYFAVVTLFMGMLTYVFTHAWDFHLPARILWVTLPSHLLLTLITWGLAHKRIAVKELLPLALLLLSVAILSAFLYDSGGHTNPLISLLLLPLAMSAATLGWRSTLLLALTATGIYSALTRFYLPLEGHGGHGEHHVMHIHLIGMWATFGVSASVIVGLVTPMASSMRRQRELIAQQQEKILRDERLVALATFAASAAHQLGTPLSTLLLISDELKDSLQDRPEVTKDLEVMQQQIGICKQTLHNIMRRTDSLRHGAPTPVLLANWLVSLRHQFNLLNPNRALQLSPSPVPTCALLQDETLDQAVLNLLDNAARASENNPVLNASVDQRHIILRIIDSGSGVPEAIQRQLGQPFISTRSEGSGMGLGLFLSHATINRFGGTLRLHSSPQGTTTEIVLPKTDQNSMPE